MECAGFSFTQNQEFIELKNYNKVNLQLAFDVLNEHILDLGGKIDVKLSMDPTK